MSFICIIIKKNHFHKKCFALGLVLKQSLAVSRKWRFISCSCRSSKSPDVASLLQKQPLKANHFHSFSRRKLRLKKKSAFFRNHFLFIWNKRAVTVWFGPVCPFASYAHVKMWKLWSSFFQAIPEHKHSHQLFIRYSFTVNKAPNHWLVMWRNLRRGRQIISK